MESRSDKRNMLIYCGNEEVTADFDMRQIPPEGKEVTLTCPVNGGNIVAKFTRENDRTLKGVSNCDCEVFAIRRVDG